eukprot:TRINITY_DN20108_c0_g1_i1.p1 TRINITY_DN20108_c0_g1~~TRINITY_DN20108_c0_g1_i1.p1  ORF type:complete len:615 (+),score=106.12 TRINITY_DN20108_c0_g1_i1:56-1846(+)
MATSSRAPPCLSPENIVRSILFVQAAVRRKLLLKRCAVGRLEAPPPPLACAVSFCSYMLDKRPRHVENEAMGICALICGRDSERPDRWQNVPGLTLGLIKAAYDYYLPKIGEGHPVLDMLQERFREVAVDVDEDIHEAIKDVALPHIARRIKQEICVKWGTPDSIPGGDPKESMFPHVDNFIARLREVSEKVILQQLQSATTRASLEALRDAVERELGSGPTPSRGRVNRALQQHREFTESAAQTHYGWPPAGPLTKLCLAARTYAVELGRDHPVVDDFVGSVLRLRAKYEKSCTKQLEPFEKNALRLRKLLNVEGQAKLLAESYREELKETVANAQDSLEHFGIELGDESEVYSTHFRNILGPEEFPAYAFREVEKAAEKLRELGPAQDPMKILDEPPQDPENLEQRMATSSRLAHLLRELRTLGGAENIAVADKYADEFSAELMFIAPLDAMMHPPDAADEDDGWHQPPGFRHVDIPYVPPKPATPPPPSPPRPPTPPPPSNHIRVKVRLHGVTIDDVRCRSEILLMERCADIVASECGVPREWLDCLRVRGGVTAAGDVEEVPRDAPLGEFLDPRTLGLDPVELGLDPATFGF